MSQRIEGLKQEIAEHQTLEAQLKDSLQFAQSIIETVREPLLVLDAQMQVTQANRAFYHHFQMQKEAVEGVSIYELGQGEWNISQLRALLETVLPENTEFIDFEVNHHFPHIGSKTLLLNARRIYHEDNGTQRVLLAMEDITQRKATEAQIQEYVKKLEWSNRELQDFAYIASHDLQEPLRAIQAFSERLRTKHGDSLDAEGHDYLERVQKAAGRMRVLIRDLLTYSRVTTKAKAFDVVDLSAIVKLVLSDLATRLEETGGRVQFDQLPVIEADATQMRQLLQNLIDNGLKFHRDGVPPIVTIRVEAASPDEATGGATPIRAGETVDFCRIVVEDNGIGFAQKYAERIFTPFERLHNASQYTGTGIGLAVCRKIIERHGGSIVADSTPGTGTKFLMRFPLYQPKQQ